DLAPPEWPAARDLGIQRRPPTHPVSSPRLPVHEVAWIRAGRCAGEPPAALGRFPPARHLREADHRLSRSDRSSLALRDVSRSDVLVWNALFLRRDRAIQRGSSRLALAPGTDRLGNPSEPAGAGNRRCCDGL